MRDALAVRLSLNSRLHLICSAPDNNLLYLLFPMCPLFVGTAWVLLSGASATVFWCVSGPALLFYYLAASAACTVFPFRWRARAEALSVLADAFQLCNGSKSVPRELLEKAAYDAIVFCGTAHAVCAHWGMSRRTEAVLQRWAERFLRRTGAPDPTDWKAALRYLDRQTLRALENTASGALARVSGDAERAGALLRLPPSAVRAHGRAYYNGEFSSLNGVESAQRQDVEARLRQKPQASANSSA